MGFKFEIKSNTRKLDALIRRVNKFNRATISAGYYPEQMHPTWNIPLSTIAAINERGYFGVPARNFMWQSFWNWKAGNANQAKYVFNQFVYKNKPMSGLLKEVGESMTHSIHWTIAFEGTFRQNSPVTIAYKGFNYPLVNTGYLMNHAKFKIKY